MERLTAKSWPFDYPAFRKKCNDLGFKDYQCWWYASLLAWAYLKKERPGYLLNKSSQLYEQAGVTAQLPLGGHLLAEWGAVLARFGVTDDGQWLYHRRVLREVDHDLSVRTSRSKAACKKYSANAEQMQNPGIDVVINNNFFEPFWKSYPRKVAREYAEKCYRKTLKTLIKRGSASFTDPFGEPQTIRISSELDAAEFLQRAVGEFAASASGRRTDRQFIPHPSTWLNQAHYLDDRREWSNHKNGSGKFADLDDLYGDEK